MAVLNQTVAGLLSEIAIYLEMQDVPFKPRAYEKAASAVAALAEGVENIYRRGGIKALEEIPGVGLSIAEKIEEFITTGRVKYYEELKRKTPVKLSELQNIEGVGPKSIKKLYSALGIQTLADLEAAARAGKVKALKGFGEKAEKNILRSIEFAKRSQGRFVLGFVMPEIRVVEERLRAVKGVERVVVAGSVRRRKETVGDIDFLAISDSPKLVMDYFVNMPEVARVYAHGETKSAVKVQSGIDMDLRVVSSDSYGAALNYFTGSKDHNVALRELAMEHGFKLNEYGLFKQSGKREMRVAGESEEEIYRALGMDYIEPELRENRGEIEAARNHRLPKLIKYDALQGDLQVQTDWTDGSDSIETMAREAIAYGLKYIAITDHTKHLAMTHGLDERRIREQWKEIDAVNEKLKGRIVVLKGSECDILKDGTLDLPDDVLAQLDVVGAAVHSHFNLTREEQTARIVRAMRNPHVDILFHPTGRIINRREAYEMDIAQIVRAAKETGTVLEVDAYPDRLDLNDECVRMCVDAGVKLAIDSDAHAAAHFGCLECGIAQARRGWANKSDIINAWPIKEALAFLKKR